MKKQSISFSGKGFGPPEFRDSAIESEQEMYDYQGEKKQERFVLKRKQHRRERRKEAPWNGVLTLNRFNVGRCDHETFSEF